MTYSITLSVGIVETDARLARRGYGPLMKTRAALGCVALLLAVLAPISAASPSSAAVECKPYCDDTTIRIANRLNGRGHGAWLATTLDIGGYHGRRWAEITLIPRGHGKRSMGVIHVPRARIADARRAVADVWFAYKGSVILLPLVSSTYTDGGTGANFRIASWWAARKLGKGWRVHKP